MQGLTTHEFVMLDSPLLSMRSCLRLGCHLYAKKGLPPEASESEISLSIVGHS